jgi:SAM-dependent methyltransferase
MLKQIVRKARSFMLTKQDAELVFWKNEINNYQKWFVGELSPHYQTKSPKDCDRVKAPNLRDASILTWHKLHQEVKYLVDLDLQPDVFQGMNLLDIGAGPMPSATCFSGCRLYCLEPLLGRYLEAGFPIHYYEGVKFIQAACESIPVEDGFFDAIIAVNAFDHVDDIRQTTSEIRRVLKTDGLIRIHVHYHLPTKCEPNKIDDELLQELFLWCNHFVKISESKNSHCTRLPIGESFALWGNF